MRPVHHIHRLAAALLLAVLLVVVVCSGMAAVPSPAAQTMPADCPLHPHQEQPASCCTVNQRHDALAESQVKLPDLADMGHAPQAMVQVAVVLPLEPKLLPSITPPPLDLIAIRI